MIEMKFSFVSRLISVFVGLLVPASAMCQNVAADWNAIGLTTIVTVGKKPPSSSAIFFAYETVAMYDAANSIQRRYKPFAVSVDAPKRASVDAAVVAAAHDVLVHYFQDQQGALDALEANTLSQIADSQAKTEGIAVGQAVAQRWNDLRTGDGLEAPIQYAWGHGPGIWEPVPPFPPPVTPWLPYFRPFTYARASDFRSIVPPPPALHSATWAVDYYLTKNFGALEGSLRTPKETEIGQFWSDHPLAQYSSAIQSLIADRKLSTMQTVRLLAMTYVSYEDAIIACFDAKYYYAFWRPYTAIHDADIDGNPFTTPDPGWMPLVVTPGHPEYPAAHGCAAGAFAVTIAQFFHTDAVPTHFTSAVTGTTHDFSKLSDEVQEVDLARIYGGMHYLTSVLEGNVLGKAVARHVVSNYFQPLER
jgi:PAP2 superfamily